MHTPGRNEEITLSWMFRLATLEELAARYGVTKQAMHEVITKTLKYAGMPTRATERTPARAARLASLIRRRVNAGRNYAKDTPEHFYHHEQMYRSGALELAKVHGD